MVAGLQRRLDTLEGRRSAGSDVPPLESGWLDEEWGPRPGLGRPRALRGSGRSEHPPSTRGGGGV